MRPVLVFVALLASLLYNTPAHPEPTEYELVMVCRSGTDAMELLDLAQQHKHEAALRRFWQFNRLQGAACGIKTLGKVVSFEIIKKYPPMSTVAEDATVEAWVVKATYADGEELYVILDRFASIGRRT